MAEGDKPHGVRLLVVLILAAALGCGVGYLAYLQLPPPVIPLSIRSQPPNLLVSWPASQTRNTSYAAIRVNDGEPMPLSAAERSSGEAQIAAQGDNVKVEVISQHWIRDSRGIIRYVKAQRVPSPPPAGNATPGGVRPSEVR
jgi:hypothetical protein